MIALAYSKTSEGGASKEIVLGRLIDRFGVQAVMNRPYLGAGEINRILAAERVERANAEKEKHEDWSEYAKRNTDDAELLAYAMIAAEEEGLLDG